MTFRNLLVALAAGSLLILVGCSSSSDNNTATDDDMQDPQPMAVDTSGVASGAMVQAGSYTIAAGQSATHGDITYSCAAGGEDCMVEVMADGTTTSAGGMATAMNSAGYDERVRLVGLINTLRTQLGLAPGADVGTSITQLQDDLRNLQKQVQDQKDEEAMEEALAIAAMLAAGTPDSTVTDNSAGRAAAPSLMATATRSAAGTKITVTGGTGTFKSTDMVSAPMIGGIASDVQMRKSTAGTTPATEETVAIYTDIEAPMSKSVDFDDYYGDATDGTARLNADGLASITAGAATVSTSSIPAAARAKFTSSMFPVGSRKSYTYGTGDDDKADATDGIAGYFDGIQGMYVCATGCVVTNDQDGNVETFGGTWTFTPDSRTAMVTQVTADAQYLYFGWWQRTTKTAGGDVLAFDPFYGGTNPVTTNPDNAMTGKAVYEGPATGKYATKSFDAGGLASAMAGEFTAKAMLTADFGAADVAGTISGEVMDFMANGESLGDWSVMLEEVDLSDSTVTDTDRSGIVSGVITGTTAAMIGDAEGTGEWGGQFFGGAATGVTGDAAHPKSVAGDFTADFPAAHISGAFGANLQ